jgi:hypothetical protein
MSHARSHSSADHAAPHLPASPSAAPAAPGKQPLTLAGAAAPLQAAGRAPGAPIASDAVAGAPRGGEGTPLPGEALGTVSQPVREISPACAADGVAEALDRARTAWISGRDGHRLRRDLVRLLADLED